MEVGNLTTGDEVFEAYSNRKGGTDVFAVQANGEIWGCTISYDPDCLSPRLDSPLAKITFSDPQFSHLADAKSAVAAASSDREDRGVITIPIWHVGSDLLVGNAASRIQRARKMKAVGEMSCDINRWVALGHGRWTEEEVQKVFEAELEAFVAWDRGERYFWAIYYPNEEVLDAAGGYVGEASIPLMCADLAMSLDLNSAGFEF